MERKQSKEEQYLLGVRQSMQNVFKSEDGKNVLEFLESMTCYHYAMPKDCLDIGEGARRVTCLIKNFIKDTPEEMFLQHCDEHYNGKRFFQ